MKHFRAWLEKLYQSYLNENDNFENSNYCKFTKNGLYLHKLWGDVDENSYFAEVKRNLHWNAVDENECFSWGDVDENECFTYVTRILRWTDGRRC